MDEFRKKADLISYGLLALGLLLILTGHFFTALLMLGTSAVVWRFSDVHRLRVEDRHIREIEDYANRRDDE